MKTNEFQLRKELGALDMMIAALTADLAHQQGQAEKKAGTQIIKQMGEAIVELRRRRGQTKFLLVALERTKRRA
jgi:hypothetical protein